MVEYAALREEAGRTRARILFADEAHFRADAELRGKWVLRGEPALVDSTSPRYGEKASYRRCAWRRARSIGWNWMGNSGTSVAFLRPEGEAFRAFERDLGQRAGPSWRGDYLRTPGLGIRLVNLPGYSPDFNADEAIWGWAREEATAICAWEARRRWRRGSANSCPV